MSPSSASRITRCIQSGRRAASESPPYFDRDDTSEECWEVRREFNLNPHGYVSKATLHRILPDCRDSKGIELLGSIVWYRSKAIIKKISKGGHSETPSSHPPSRKLPQELVEMIIAHVLLDTPTLKVCSTTCRSWYLAALPHLHHTLTLRQWASDPVRQGFSPLQKLGKMRLLPFVTRLRIVLNFAGPDPPRTIATRSAPVHFSALTNIEELTIEVLDFRDLAPQIELYFGHFAPKLRSLALNHPRGARRDLLFFIGLFPNLDDLKITYNGTDERIPVHSSVPQSVPSVRGCLALRSFGGGRFLRELSELCGGLRFHSVDLVGAEGARLLLDACADTLETLRVHPGYWNGMQCSRIS